MLFSPGALAAMAASLAISGCGKESPAVGAGVLPPAPVRVQTVERKPHLATEDVVGTVQAKLRAVIEAKVSARIEQMLVAPGQSVKAGELLARLDAREIQARLDQAVATREQAGRDTERLRPLVSQNAISKQDFETVESRHRVAAAAAREAETMLDYTRVVAPFSGVITRKLADVGDLAAPGRGLLEMDDPTVLRLEAGL